MFMEDFTRGRLLQTLGLPDDTLSQKDDIKHRCFVPISNGTAQVGADRGTHWSLLVFDIKRENSGNLEIRGIHFDSSKSSKRSKRSKKNSQQVTVEMIDDKMRSLLGESVHLHSNEAEGVPQQTNGYSCGDYVIFFAETLAVLPFMSSVREYTDDLVLEYNESRVVKTRTRLIAALKKSEVDLALEQKRLSREESRHVDEGKSWISFSCHVYI